LCLQARSAVNSQCDCGHAGEGETDVAQRILPRLERPSVGQWRFSLCPRLHHEWQFYANLHTGRCTSFGWQWDESRCCRLRSHVLFSIGDGDSRASLKSRQSYGPTCLGIQTHVARPQDDKKLRLGFFASEATKARTRSHVTKHSVQDRRHGERERER
jgi:hypothetical protein